MGMVTIIIGLVLILIALAGFTFIESNAKVIATLPLFVGIVFLIAGIGISLDVHTPKEPTALDVYRGNTTLEITYRDSIPIDSVVVFKTK